MEFLGVGLRYGQGPEILKEIRFSLEKGSFYFLTGESGAGKSSLLSLMYLALKPTRGQINVFGTNTSAAKRKELFEIRRRIGVVFQDFRLLDHLTAVENVALPLRVAGMREEEINNQVTELLSWVGLENHLNAKPPTMAGGQQQRVAIARAVINRPDILLADEPTGNVDSKMATRLMRFFVELNRLGTTIVIATHSEEIIRKFNFPRLHLSSGRLKILPPMTADFGETL
ncbi:MAG: cell division ATP-binding protein FtsE [Alphaproteobacteria bacterium]